MEGGIVADVELVPYGDDLFDRFAEVFAEEASCPCASTSPAGSTP